MSEIEFVNLGAGDYDRAKTVLNRAKHPGFVSIIQAVQGKGVGSALMHRLQPKWVNAIAERISFFEKLGYKPFGAPKVGANGKHATQLMERGDMPANDAAPTAERAPRHQESEPPPPTLLVDLVDESRANRLLAQLTLLDEMLAKAVRDDNTKSVLEITERATSLWGQLDRLRETQQ